MALPLTQSRRLQIVIGISLCFFIAEVSGIKYSTLPYTTCPDNSSSWILHKFSRTRRRCIPLCRLPCSDSLIQGPSLTSSQLNDLLGFIVAYAALKVSTRIKTFQVHY